MSFSGKHFLKESSSLRSEFPKKFGSIFLGKLRNDFLGKLGSIFPRNHYYKGICFLEKHHFGEIISLICILGNSTPGIFIGGPFILLT
jgi:hypothetical protein